MSVRLDDCLVVTISSRALFQLDKENEIYETQGLAAYEAYQKEHEYEVLEKGTGFYLIQSLLALNELTPKRRRVEVVLVSRNGADTSLRIFHSIAHYGLDITRAAWCGKQEIIPYLKAFQSDLFLSADADDVKNALAHSLAAGYIYTRDASYYQNMELLPIRLAFDGDAVLFSDEAERIFQTKGLDAFVAHEVENAKQPLLKGPFAKLLKTIADLQEEFHEDVPIVTALVTARNAPAHERVIQTLRAWNVKVDEAFFLGGLSKQPILEAFHPHIFFDDQKTHVLPASDVVPSAQILSGLINEKSR